MPKLSVVVPAYNEGDKIRENLEEFTSALSGLNYDYELIVVDDGSTDNTYEEALKHESDRVRVLTYPKNHGKGHALQHGVSHATGDLVTFIDADLDLHPSQTKVLLDYMSMNGAAIVVGSKWHPLSRVSYPLKRRFLSTCYRLLTRSLFGLNTDTQTGLKLFKRDALLAILPRALVKRYAFDLELVVIARHLGYEVVEAPVVLNYQFNGSGVDWRAIWRIFVDTCAIFYRLNILRYYDRKHN